MSSVRPHETDRSMSRSGIKTMFERLNGVYEVYLMNPASIHGMHFGQVVCTIKGATDYFQTARCVMIVFALVALSLVTAGFTQGALSLGHTQSMTVRSVCLLLGNAVNTCKLRTVHSKPTNLG